MVGFDQKLFAAQVPRKRVDRVVYRVGLALVGIPFLGGVGEAFGTESNGLIGNSTIFVSVYLEQDGSNSVLTGVTSYDPRKVITGKIKLGSLLDAFFEAVEVVFVLESPLGSIPGELVWVVS